MLLCTPGTAHEDHIAAIDVYISTYLMYVLILPLFQTFAKLHIYPVQTYHSLLRIREGIWKTLLHTCQIYCDPAFL